MALTDTTTPGSPTTEANETEGNALTKAAEWITLVGGAVIVAFTLWNIYKGKGV